MKILSSIMSDSNNALVFSSSKFSLFQGGGFPGEEILVQHHWGGLGESWIKHSHQVLISHYIRKYCIRIYNY